MHSKKLRCQSVIGLRMPKKPLVLFDSEAKINLLQTTDADDKCPLGAFYGEKGSNELDGLISTYHLMTEGEPNYASMIEKTIKGES